MRRTDRSNHAWKTLAAAAIFACSGSVASAQSWVRQAPLPTNRPLYSVAFSTPTHGFVVALNGTVCETTDAGQTWTTRFQQPYSTDPMYKIVFADAMHGYIAGNPGSNFNKRTVDGGATWLPMPQLDLGSTYFLDFITPTTGFASPGGFGVGFTQDGGVTWQTRLHDPAIQWFGMDFVDENLGLVAGPLYATRKQHDYFYGVAPEYATAARPAYSARGGYSGSQFLASLSRRFDKTWVGAFVRYDSLRSAVFVDSPLVARRNFAAAGIAISWVIDESKTRVLVND